ncbi:WD40 repeat-like protein [Aspergillus homomorphus CBS 101889]|uniref:Mitochondrial division protein 1 n=1 Tax=Aspergillus homomorphus (strain CBS 101889) TaxID=1450537 RepID=A0A395HJ84_ASPHC|nr:WD40 repeat-like protein [Aspergillus homomorphus CBS 101889]RAL07840.1 WD40 repeat-like protein [Aspergillus homomorphus CBS 101889]
MNSTAYFTGHNAGIQVGQNPGQINSQFNYNYYNQQDDSKSINPELDKQRIEKEKGGLLRDSYRWVLDHDDFKSWRYTAGNQMLWIKGDPGKGKTMLICGIINELSEKATQDNINIAYFFCQATNARINSATAILQGLISMLGKQQPLLQTHIPAKFFGNENGWFELRSVFGKILQDPAIKKTYLMIDALDECVTDQDRLLEFIEEESSGHQHVRWIVSSRNWPSIEKYLDNTTGIRLQLELNEDKLAAAVNYFIKYKVEELSKRNKYTLEKRKMVENHLLLNAKGTFLWVALVCKQLKDISARHLQKKLKDFPPGLDEFYHRMFGNIQDLDDDVELCLSLLGIITTVYRPITLDELSLYLESQDEILYDDLQEIVKLCGSFLTLQNRIITLVHQSAQDFLLTHASQDIAPHGIQGIHYSIFSKSLKSLHETLQQDIYNLGDPAVSIIQVNQPDPDPLATIRYACVHWTDHLKDYFPRKETSKQIQDTMLLDTFLRQDLLHWVEALSLIRILSEGAKSMIKLEELLKVRARETELISRVQDAYRFIIHNRVMIESYPLQTYVSAIFFCPQESITRHQFGLKVLEWISGKNVVEERWSACLQTLEGHNDSVRSIVFSHDSKILASASYDKTIKLWDTDSGTCLQTLEGHDALVFSIVFSHNSKLLASASGDNTVKLWDTDSGACLQTLEDHDASVWSVVFSHNSKLLASASGDNTVKLWDTDSGTCLQTLKGHDAWVHCIVFSHNSKLLASASGDKTIKLWDTNSSACLQRLEGHDASVFSIVFSHESKLLASASGDNTVKLWDTDSGACLQTLEGHDTPVWSVVFSHDSKLIASASDDKTVKLWDTGSGTCLQTLEGHDAPVWSVVFSHDSKLLASASNDKTVKLWDTGSGACLQTLKGHNAQVQSVVFSHDSKLLASASGDNTVKLWDAGSSACLQTVEGHNDWVRFLVFSHDSKLLASASGDKTVKLWDTDSGTCLQTLKGHTSASDDNIIKLWDTGSGTCLQTLGGHDNIVFSMIFSYDSKLLASASDDKTVKLWDAGSGVCLQTLKGHGNAVIKLDIINSSLETNMGIFNLSFLAEPTFSQARHEVLHSQGFGISPDQTWITWNSVNLLKLPSIFKVSASADESLY